MSKTNNKRIDIQENWNRNRKWRILAIIIWWFYGTALFLMASLLVFISCYQNGNSEMGIILVAVMSVTAFSVAWKFRHTLGELRK